MPRGFGLVWKSVGLPRVTHQAGDEVLVAACHHSHCLRLFQQAVYPARVLFYVDKSLFFVGHKFCYWRFFFDRFYRTALITKQNLLRSRSSFLCALMVFRFMYLFFCMLWHFTLVRMAFLAPRCRHFRALSLWKQQGPMRPWSFLWGF